MPHSGPLLPAISAAVRDQVGVDIAPESFRPEAILAFLRPTLRVLDERGKVLSAGRDCSEILQRWGAQARETLRRLAPPPKWERTGLTSWNFDDLPPFVTRRALGTELRSYPALVDRQKSVDLVLFESADEAELATRQGLARLLTLASVKTLASLAARIPAPPSRHPGLPPPRAEAEAFRELVLLRAVGTAFDLGGAAPLPRSKSAFDALLVTGTPRLEPSLKTWIQALTAATNEREHAASPQRRVEAAERRRCGSRHSSPTRAAVPARPRELHRAARALAFPALPARRSSAPDARRDGSAQRRRQVRARRAAVVDVSREAADRARSRAGRALRWAFEELRVAIFAPELKPALPVSVASLSQSIAALR